MNAIVNVNSRWAIGKEGGLLYSIPEDMRFFRETTSGKTVVMGRSTLRSLPGGKPLKNRRNIVLTHNPPAEDDGAVYCASFAELVSEIKKDDIDDVFIIGGGMMYSLMVPYCKTAYVTRVYDDAPGDTYFPDLDADPRWKITERSGIKEHNGAEYEFLKYENTALTLFE